MLNRVTLIGRLGSDAEVTSSYTRFSLATTQSWKDKNGEWHEKTEWHRITIFSQKPMPKGALVYVEGSLTYTEKDGRFYTNIVASTLRWMNKPKQHAHPESEPAPAHAGDDDLPF